MFDGDYDTESNTVAVCVKLLDRLNFDQKWRVLNYLLSRVLGRSWALNKPKGE
jgi:hypothetical protein